MAKKEPKPTSAGVLIEAEGKFLLVRATPDPTKVDPKIHWGVPKGKIDKGETAIVAAMRETWEETGIKLGKYKGQMKLHKKYSTKWKNFIVFHLKMDKQIPTSKMKCRSIVPGRGYPEIDKYKWATKEEALKMIKNHGRKIFIEVKKIQQPKIIREVFHQGGILYEAGGKEFYDALSAQGFKREELFNAKVPLEYLKDTGEKDDEGESKQKKFTGDLNVKIPVNTDLLEKYIDEYVHANVELKKKFDVFAYWYDDFNKLIYDNLGQSDGSLFLAAVAFTSANTALDVNILEAAKLYRAVKTDFKRGNKGRQVLKFIANNVKTLEDGKSIEMIERAMQARSAYARMLAPKVDPRPIEITTGKGKAKVKVGEKQDVFREITVSGAKLGNFNKFVLYYLENNGKLSKSKLMKDLQAKKFDIGGTKIYSFFINLVDPDFEWKIEKGNAIQPATIDRWMIRLFFDEPIKELVDELIEVEILDPKKKEKTMGAIAMGMFNQDIVRQSIVNLLNAYALKTGMKAHQLQALGWVRIRNEYDRPEAKFKDFKDVMAYADKTTEKIDEIDPELRWIKQSGLKVKSKINSVMSTLNVLYKTPRFKFSKPEEVKYSLANRSAYEHIYTLTPKDISKKDDKMKEVIGKFMFAVQQDNKTIDIYREIEFTHKKTGKKIKKVDKKDPVHTVTEKDRKSALKSAIKWAKKHID